MTEFEDLAIQIEMRKADLRGASLAILLSQPLYWVLPPLMAGAFWRLSAFSLPRGWAYGLGMLILLYYASASGAMRAATKTPGAMSPMTLVFSEEGVAARMVSSHSMAEWSLVKGARETKQHIRVEMQRKTCHVIPKSQISDEQASRLRAILKTKLNEKARFQ